MTRRAMLFAMTVLGPIAAHAECSDEVAADYARANALPPSNGRSALLEQIQRAEIAHHEGDEEECQSAVSDATEVLSHVQPLPPVSGTQKQ